MKGLIYVLHKLEAETTLYKVVSPKLIWKPLGKEAVMKKKLKPQKKHGASLCSINFAQWKET